MSGGKARARPRARAAAPLLDTPPAHAVLPSAPGGGGRVPRALPRLPPPPRCGSTSPPGVTLAGARAVSTASWRGEGREGRAPGSTS